jgi:SAM-dependent methyltransferase
MFNFLKKRDGQVTSENLDEVMKDNYPSNVEEPKEFVQSTTGSFNDNDVELETASLIDLENNSEFQDVETAPIPDVIPNDYPESYLIDAPQVAGWLSTQEQELLFSALLLYYTPTQSVLDVGCARADLYGYLRRLFNTDINYTGMDYNANLLNIAERKFPTLKDKLIAQDILKADVKQYDWVFGSGLFNLNDYPDMFEYAKQVVDKMYENATVGVAFNVLTGLPDDMAQSDIDQLFVHNPSAWLEYLISKYGKVLLRSDYMLGDVTFVILK